MLYLFIYLPPYFESAIIQCILPPLSLFSLYRKSHADHATPSDCSAKDPHLTINIIAKSLKNQNDVQRWREKAYKKSVCWTAYRPMKLMMTEFLDKNWKRKGLDKLLKKLCVTGLTDRWGAHNDSELMLRPDGEHFEQTLWWHY